MATVVLEGELTEEGKKMWQNLMDYATLVTGNSIDPPKKPKKLKINIHEIENSFYRLELRRLIHNSELVIKDCDKILDKCRTMEDYIKNDAKVAKTIHTNLIMRLKRVLNMLPAFEHEIILPDEVEKPNPLYVDTTKRK